MKMLKIIAIVLSVMVSGAGKGGDQQYNIHEVHSKMIYNVMKYVNWPGTSGDFVIGVIGQDEVYEQMLRLYGTKSKGTQKIAIKKFSSVADISTSHILYIGRSNSKSLEAILAKTSGESTLVITNKQGLAKKGSAINFRAINGKFKFELNEKVIAKAKLKVSGQLLKIAILIR